MAGVQAGRLSIEIVAEIARLQQDLDKAKRAVKSMSNDIARDTRAANDNITRMGTGFANTAQGVTRSAGGTRAAMQQLSFQLGDVAQGFAMGTRPMTIFAQQSGQVIQALSLMTNSTKGFLGFMAGPWGLVLSAAAVVLVPLIAKLFEAEEAVKKVEFASYKLGDAQGILGSVMDMTTGKINTQKDALLGLARAQILAGQIQARADMAAARSSLGGIAASGFNITGGMGGGFRVNTGVRRTEAGIIQAFTEGSMNTQEAVRGLDSLRRTGMITEKAFLDAAKAVTDFGVASENLGVFQGAERMLNGRGTAADRRDFLDPAKAKRERKGREGPSAEDIARRYNDQLLALTLQSLDAMGQVATTTEERVDLEMRALEWQHRQVKQQIAADDDFNAAQKAELTAAAERLAEYRREALEFRKRAELQQQAQQIAAAQHQAATESLNAQLALATTEAARKELALQIFDAEMAYLRAKLEAVRSSEVVSETERKLAEIQLQALDATQNGRRQGVANANATSVERYLTELNATKEQLDEQMDQIGIKGLEALEQGLLDVVTGVKSIGDAFREVTNQIMADLMRIAIRQMIIKPLANALFGGGVGGNAYGTNYWGGGPTWVGEDGPEIVNLPRGAQVVPSHQSANDNSRGGGVHFHFPNVTNAREAREAGSQAAREYRRKLNGPVRQ
jgi:hypothetical protein